MSLANYHFFLFFIERFSPIGICSLIAGEFVAMDDIMDNIKSLGMYITTVIVGTFIHCMVILPCIYFIVVRKNPFRLFIRVAKALLTGLGTGSR